MADDKSHGIQHIHTEKPELSTEPAFHSGCFMPIFTNQHIIYFQQLSLKFTGAVYQAQAYITAYFLGIMVIT